MNPLYELTECTRRLENLIRLGKVVSVDYAKAKAKVKIGDIETAYLPWITAKAGRDQTWWAPDLDEQVMVLSPSGDYRQGVILGSVYQVKYKAPSHNKNEQLTRFRDGTTMSYDTASNQWVLHCVGDVTVTADGNINAYSKSSVNVTAASSISLKAPTVAIQAENGNTKASLSGDFNLKGNLTIDGSIHASGDVLCGGRNSNHHGH